MLFLQVSLRVSLQVSLWVSLWVSRAPTCQGGMPLQTQAMGPGTCGHILISPKLFIQIHQCTASSQPGLVRMSVLFVTDIMVTSEYLAELGILGPDQV